MEICVSGDALYFSEPMLKEIKEKNWKYIVTYKEGRAQSVAEYYNMEHAYSYHENAVKGHFILLTIAHIIMQLMEMHERNIGIFETIHKISQRIKEALKTQPLSASDVLDISTSFHLSRISL